ncbi:hypothetical protein IMSHALPRED_007864 [Imshaugia aleurites]|uniref:Myb/SANT-like domain-containing protein n=1 Tax=Imshaugia aleurites TaxID=172621 RepID=A0A8H3FSK7_9LECA|nr:hypothetical protein IMSHALPRED_007864 [Imshaugia aleurites]
MSENDTTQTASTAAAHTRAHCTQHPILTPAESEYLITLAVDWVKSTNFDRQQPTRPDWDGITARFNAKFGAPKRWKSSILCAFGGLKEPFLKAFFVAEWEWMVEREAARAREGALGGV